MASKDDKIADSIDNLTDTIEKKGFVTVIQETLPQQQQDTIKNDGIQKIDRRTALLLFLSGFILGLIIQHIMGIL